NINSYAGWRLRPFFLNYRGYQRKSSIRNSKISWI
ncbi:hypothetical protein LTSEWAN_1026, partial [Salmonella enterica subsp. enterica serovar Wandsworth str. A4-580]